MKKLNGNGLHVDLFFSLEYGSLGSYAEIIDQGCVTATCGLNEFA